MAFLFVVFFWNSYDSNVEAFDIVPEVSEVVFISFNSFFFFCLYFILFPPFYLPSHLSYLLPQLFYCWFPPVQFSSVQSLSRVRLFATPWIAARQATLSITNSWSSPSLMSIKSVMPSSHLILSSPSPPAPNPSQHQSLFQ